MQFVKSKDPKKNISVSLRPRDPTAKPILSASVKTKNLLLKISVPRRTGRKRKRGSSAPFANQPESSEGLIRKDVDAELVLRSMRDNPEHYSVEPVGVIGETHRFRCEYPSGKRPVRRLTLQDLPDFQYAASTEPLMQNLRKSMLASDCTSNCPERA